MSLAVELFAGIKHSAPILITKDRRRGVIKDNSNVTTAVELF